MRPLTLLRKEHTVLREKLALLERLLPISRATELPIRELREAIHRTLRCHMEQEAFLVAAQLEGVAHARDRRLTRHVADAHEEQWRTLQVLLGVLATSHGDTAATDRTQQAHHLIRRLHALLDTEETEVFSLLMRPVDPSHTREQVDHLYEIAAHAHREDEPAIPPAREL